MELVPDMCLCVLLLLEAPLVYSTQDDIISARVGDNVTLQCNASDVLNFEDTALEWTRIDLGQFVFFYRHGRPDPHDQHPSFKNRVDLVHSQLEDGDLSVLLKNVTIEDSGTYECHLVLAENRRKRSSFGPRLIRTINLKVLDEGSSGNDQQTEDDGGHEDRRRPGLIVGGTGLVSFMVFLGLWSFFRGKKQNSENPENKDMFL